MNVVVMPLLLPLVTALVLVLVRRQSWTPVLAVGSGVAQLLVALGLVWRTADGSILVLSAGHWSAPYGIVMVADLLAAIMLTLSTATVLAGMVYGLVELPARVRHPLRLPLVQFLTLGIHLAFLTGDLFNLFVAFEILLVASYALLTLEADNWDIKQAFPYVAMNAVSSTLFFCGAGLMYGLVGTLNLADISARAGELVDDPRLMAVSLLLVGVFGMKAGLFPLYYWLPHSYPTLATPVAGIFAGLLTKVGIYVLIRMCATVLPHGLEGLHTLIAWLSGLTMILGVLGAISRNFIRGILSFHILSQVAFMTLALGFFTPLSVAAAIFYIVHHILVKGSLFLVGGVAALLNRSDDLSRMGNLWKVTPWLGVVFLAQALSLAGLPPLSGFWGKYLIVVEGMAQGQYVLVAASLVASVLTLFSMLKIWLAAFWREDEAVPVRLADGRWRPMAWICGVVTVVSLAIGLGAEPLLQLARQAAETAMDQEAYQAAVFAVQGKDAIP
jgi:multicomponent Na+:H+ antiporter subunit D